MKAAVITGASSGIGKEMVRQLSKENWTIYMVARSKEKLQEMESQIPHTKALACDLTDPQQIQTIAEVISKDENFSCLINNAGIYQPESVDQDEDATWQVHFESNLMSAVRLTRQLWPSLKKQKGSILNISSTLAIRPIANTAAYSALKAAMNNWTLSLALEGAPHGIRANAICPGIVETPIHGFYGSDKPEDLEILEAVQKAQPLGRIGKPDDIARVALSFCDPHNTWTTGSILNVDGGILLNS